MSRDPSLNSMIYFESVARHGRVARAAEELHVSASAVSQQIKQLEENLGISLFRREKRQLSLTQEGEQLYMAATSAFTALRDARKSISRQRESPQLIMRASPSFAVRWLGPRLSDFIAEHPTWDFRVDASPDPSNFEREVVDLDLRYGRGNWPGLHCEAILYDYLIPMCSPAYLDALKQRSLSVEERLTEARLIDSVKTTMQWENWLARYRIQRRTDNSALRFDRSSMAIQQAVNGLGVVLDSTTLAQEELTEGRLVPLAPELGAIRFPAYWIVSPARHQSRRLVKVFSEWIKAQAQQHSREVEAYLAQHKIAVIDEEPAL